MEVLEIRLCAQKTPEDMDAGIGFEQKQVKHLLMNLLKVYTT